MEWGAVGANPCLGVKKHSIPKRSRHISDEEFKGAWKAVTPTVKNMMDFAYLTALRIGDILDTRLSDLQEDDILVEINKVKQKTARKVLIQ